MLGWMLKPPHWAEVLHGVVAAPGFKRARPCISPCQHLPRLLREVQHRPHFNVSKLFIASHWSHSCLKFNCSVLFFTGGSWLCFCQSSPRIQPQPTALSPFAGILACLPLDPSNPGSLFLAPTYLTPFTQPTFGCNIPYIRPR